MQTVKALSFAAATMIIFSGFTRASAQAPDPVFSQAMDLYENGLYEKARSLFEKVPGPLADAYVALCAAKANTSDYPDLIIRHETRYPKTVLSSELHYQYALNLFDAGEYAAANNEFSRVDGSGLVAHNAAEYNFKRGYCALEAGNFTSARDYFAVVETLPKSPYTAAARYQMGFMSYSEGDFAKAAEWFSMTTGDLRFKGLAKYYIMECRFMEKDYDYVLEHGPSMIDAIPAERQPRLARIISECYLVKGDAEKALEFYSQQPVDTSVVLSRTDLFYAGSLMYAAGDYEAAINNFERMEDRSDSIGQIANYNLGYSYIKTKNKVAAVDAFAQASVQTYDKAIREDAWFNYALSARVFH